MDNIVPVLKKLGITDRGLFKNDFYVIDLIDSDDWGRTYSQLSREAINTEFPNFGVNSNKTTTNVINYFEIEVNNIHYNIFLMADFVNDKYTLKIGEA